MIHVYAERMSVAFISSAAELSALRITSVVIGSTAVVAMLGLLSNRDDQASRTGRPSATQPGGTTVVAVASSTTTRALEPVRRFRAPRA